MPNDDALSLVTPQDGPQARSSVSPKELRDAADALEICEWYGYAAAVRFAADQLERNAEVQLWSDVAWSVVKSHDSTSCEREDCPTCIAIFARYPDEIVKGEPRTGVLKRAKHLRATIIQQSKPPEAK